jgi:aryl-alcohol dehydrogenase-like predicted oxidoreductase
VPIQKRDLGKTGHVVSQLALGTWGLSGDGYGRVDPSVRDEVIDRALAHGISLFETADCYAEGAMETVLAERVPTERGVICTMIGTDLESDPKRKRFDAEFLRAALDRCRERMQRDQLDIVLLHNPSEATMKRGEAADTMQAMTEEGKLKTWGVSAGTKEVARAAIAKSVKPGVVQLPYNVLYTSEFGALEYDLSAQGIAALARSVLAHGLLTGHWARDKVFDRGDHRTQRWTADQLARRLHHLRALRGLYSNSVRTVRAAALRFVLDNPRVSSVVIGPRDIVQLDQLVRESAGGPVYLDPTSKRNTTRRLREMGAYR